MPTPSNATPSEKPPRSPRLDGVLIVALALGYYAAARFGIQFATLNSAASLVWPATGISMAALLLGGARLWPGILAGAFLFSYLDGKSPSIASIIAVGNTVEALLTYYLCRRFSRFATDREQPRDFVFFSVVGGLLCTLASALSGLLALHRLGIPPGVSPGQLFLSWWIGNVIGALLVTPMALGLVRRSHLHWNARRVAEAVPLMLFLVVLTHMLFREKGIFHIAHSPLAFVVFPFIVWISIRFGARGAACCTLLVSALAIHGTALEQGPFGHMTFPLNMVYLQTYLLVLAVTAYSLSYASEVRLRAEERADLAWQHVQLHVERSPLGVVEWDRHFKVAGWNPAAEKIFGWTRAEAAGRHASFILPEDQRMDVDRVWAGLLSRSGGMRSTSENITRSGRRVLCDWYNIPLRDSQDRVVGAVSLVEDITEQHQAERQRQAMDRKLLEAQKLESLGVLAGGIAHDFNNLLTGILGNASLARLEVPPDSPAQESLQQIEASSQRAADLCRQMLAYSGKGRFLLEAVDLNFLIQETLPLIRMSMNKKAVLQPELAASLPHIEGDSSQLRQVIMNLVINASDAIGDKGGTILLRTSTAKVERGDLDAMQFGHLIEPGDYVSLEVEDNGAGMSKDVLARIFEPFFTTKFAGRGLGLAAVLGIVRGHKGAMSVTSQERKGTRFRIVWPCNRDAAILPHDITEESRADWRGGGRVLVVDDEDSVRTTAARMLQSLGFQPVLACDGLEGVERFQECPEAWSLVLLDLTMPHLDGTQAFAHMKKLNPSVPVLLMSGYNEQDAVRRFGKSGLAGFIQKPFTLKAIRDKVRMMTEAPRA